MAKELTDILLDAIKANDELVALTGSRVFDTSVEVPDWQDNNTKCPYLVVIDDPYQNELGTKDSVWEGSVDHCGAYIVICADTPDDVRAIRRKLRKAVEEYMVALPDSERPYLTAASSEGVRWDQDKPCYNDAIHYQCDMDVIEPSES